MLAMKKQIGKGVENGCEQDKGGVNAFSVKLNGTYNHSLFSLRKPTTNVTNRVLSYVEPL